MNRFFQSLMEQRRKFLDGLDANEDDINLDIFEDFYPDQAHFVFELLQNAEDAGATEAAFTLTKQGAWFEHNGSRAFSEADVRAITGIHDSTKTKSPDQIGKFGIGFKSVFVYTLTPTIHAADFSFQITRYVMPEPVAADPLIGRKTKFWLPFDNPKKMPDAAYTEIAGGLNELAETSLLFLPNIESIKWHIGDDFNGEILRIAHADTHVEVMKQINGKTATSAHFLKFDQVVNGFEKLRVAIAFSLDFLPNVQSFSSEKPLAKQLRIVQAQGQVAVFFPANKESSGLRFHLHAPFIPELSRASIKATPANNPLFDQLASLAASSLHEIRDLGLLTTNFLGVLPNPQDPLGGGYGYQQIRNSIFEAMKTQPLFPTHDKGHAPAEILVQAKASLKDLLNEDDIKFLVEYNTVPPRWAASRALQGTNTERFMSSLAIKNWDVTDFLETVALKTEEEYDEPDEEFMSWISQKSVDWLQRMYAMLAREPEIENELYELTTARIIRLSDGSFSSSEKCYFPDEQLLYTEIVPCVDPNIFETGNSAGRKKGAREFLEALGVKEIGERQLVEALLDKQYSTDDHPLNQRDYLAHLKRFMKLESDDNSASNMLQTYKLFLGADGTWRPANKIFLDQPFTDTGLIEYYKIVGVPKDVAPLAEFYKSLPIDTPKLMRFIETLRARKFLPISPTSCRGNPNWSYLLQVPGVRETEYSLDSDRKILKFDALIDAKSTRISRLIWNSLIDREGSRIEILKAFYRINRQGGSRHTASQLVHQLRGAEWVPQNGKFVRPAAARAELLPNGFIFDPGWAWVKEVGFGKEVELENEKTKATAVEAVEKRNRLQAAAAELGFKSDDLALLEKFKQVPADHRERLLEEWETSREAVELPDHEPRNPERRAQRVSAMAADAPERRTEERTRSVVVGREDVKAEAAQYLQQQYISDGDIICQVCKKPMPFRRDDGSVYFEKVEFLAELKNRHHQNYLALCPNHAAMFKHANGTKDFMLEMFTEILGNELELVLAQKDTTIHFTKTHIADLKKVIEVDGNIGADLYESGTKA
jgi:hypothetical protein